MNQVHQPQKTTELRRSLRKNETETEKILWSYLRKKQLGYKFIRQYGVGCYILDFYCPEKRLAIELDGVQHAEQKSKNYDKNRTDFLETLDIKVLRFWNRSVFNDVDIVLDQIILALSDKDSIPSG